MSIDYIATEFAGDPPAPIARWYKVQAGTFARNGVGGVDFFNAAQLKVELSLGVSIEFVAKDDDPADTAIVEAAWVSQRG